MQNIIPNILIVGIVISIGISIGRADYTLPLFIFGYLMWEYEKFRSRIIYMIAFTFIIDFVYIIFWGVFWDDYTMLNTNSDELIHLIVIYASLINLLLKLIIVVMSIFTDQDVKHHMNPVIMKDNLIGFLTFTNNNDD